MESQNEHTVSPEQHLKEQRQKAISGLQRELILLSGQDTLQWIELNGARFRRFVEHQPEILDRFIVEDPNQVAKEVKDLMLIEED